MTPWGDSDSLRARRLRPGPGGVREEVEQNQRERIYGAMVASVAAKGYEQTTVADLAEISGVSSRTFYDLFDEKGDCFTATLQAIIEAAVGNAAKVVTDESLGEDWDGRARAGARYFGEMVVGQPAAARMCMIEAHAVGPEALAPVEGAVAGFEALARQVAALSPERAGMPDEMIAAHTGVTEELVRTKLLAGEEEKLPDLLADLWDLFGAYRPPPVPLRLAGRLPPVRQESLEAHDHAERALRAFAVVVAERGYTQTTVSQVVRRAQMSATTFYVRFSGKEDAMLAAVDTAGAQMAAAVHPAIRRAPDWPSAVRAAYGALFNFLASRPAMARLIVVEANAAGPRALKRRIEYLQPLEELLGRGPGLSGPPITTELIAGAVYSLSYRTIKAGDPHELPRLAPLCTYLALAPYLGAGQAAAVANERGDRRP